jgi:hypothetical protein
MAQRKAAGLLCQAGRLAFVPRRFSSILGQPLVYWWTEELLNSYVASDKLGQVAPAEAGIVTGDDTRFVRYTWEVPVRNYNNSTWSHFVMGAKGLAWFEPARFAVNFRWRGLELHQYREVSPSPRFGNPAHYYETGIAFSMISDEFTARIPRRPSLIGKKGCSVFPTTGIAETLCLMNSGRARRIMESLNPGIGFEVHDVNRLPLIRVESADAILRVLDQAFTQHERAREPSIEFARPGGSPWAHGQAWAQLATDRAFGEPLPPYEPRYDSPDPAAFISYAVGVALGRFGPDGEGILEAAPRRALPGGILYISAASEHDSLAHGACDPIHAAWSEHGEQAAGGEDLRTWLRNGFFKHHKSVYENRPVHFPLSSSKKSFVAWISIHRWNAQTLSNLLAEHLHPDRRRLEGELEDLRHARAMGDKGGKSKAEKRFADVSKLLEELTVFIDLVTECAERGPPPASPDEPRRECDARYDMDLDDGVMVNSAALWPLLEPQWKDPKKWWKELATASGRKDYDWAHLAKRYFPERVEKKCVEDPSLAVAHGCFWRLHPAKAYAWELRLQDELRPDFTIDEADSEKARAAFLKAHADEARTIRFKEQERRARKARKGDAEENMSLALEPSESEAELEEVE